MAVHNAPLISAIKAGVTNPINAGVTNPINALLNSVINTGVTNLIHEAISHSNLNGFLPFYLWCKDLITKYLDPLGPNIKDGWDPL